MAPQHDHPLQRGEYAPVKAGDRRSPCPAINALANHGYLPRDGRNVRAPEVLNGMDQLGIGNVLAAAFSHPIFFEQQPDDAKAKTSWWGMITHPLLYAFGAFGMREPGQKDSNGVACLNLDQLGFHNKVEHDVSLTRLDFAQGDNISPQPDLIADLIAASSNGTTITLDDFVQHRRRRYEQQKKNNPKVEFQAKQIQVACSEVALILRVFGDGKEVPVKYVKAFFQDGRLPREEGWSKRKWWTLGLVELSMGANAIKAKDIIGSSGQGAAPTN